MKDLEPWMATAICPSCKAIGTIRRIIYGYPSEEMAMNNEIILGGCVVTYNDPKFACKDCGARCSVNKETGEVRFFIGDEFEFEPFDEENLLEIDPED